MEHMDWNEVYMLLTIHKMAHDLGTPFSHIRAASWNRLQEIEASFAPVLTEAEPAHHEEESDND